MISRPSTVNSEEDCLIVAVSIYEDISIILTQCALNLIIKTKECEHSLLFVSYLIPANHNSAITAAIFFITYPTVHIYEVPSFAIRILLTFHPRARSTLKSQPTPFAVRTAFLPTIPFVAFVWPDRTIPFIQSCQRMPCSNVEVGGGGDGNADKKN